MRTSLTLVALGLALTATAAHADMLPDNHKGLRLSIQVDAELPAGKTIVLANTFRGAHVLEPGEVQAIDWHPSGGEMQLVLVDADEAAKIEPLRGGAVPGRFDRDGIAEIVAKGTPCGEGFRGERTILDTSPAEELRWIYRVTVSGDSCEATQERRVYLDASGGEVDGDAAVPKIHRDAALADPPAPDAAPAEAESPAEEAVAKAGMATPAAKAGCGCVSDPAGAGGGGGSALAAFVLVAGRRRRRA